MAKRKIADTTGEPAEAAEPTAPEAGREEQADAGPPDVAKSKWLPRFEGYTDPEAGVRLIEDRENRRMTIKFDAKPSKAVLDVMKQESGYRFDGEDELWYKFINPAKPRQTRAEAEEVVVKVANMVRQDKGLPEKALGFNR
jgi:hypothetical protein